MDAPSPTSRAAPSLRPCSPTGWAWLIRLGLAVVLVLGTLASATVETRRGEAEGEGEAELELDETGESLTRHQPEVRVNPRGSEHAPRPGRPLAKLRAPARLEPTAGEPDVPRWLWPRRRPPPDDDDVISEPPRSGLPRAPLTLSSSRGVRGHQSA